jgi:hypothetical protein
MLYDKNAPMLERAIGYAAGSLKDGWKLYTPRNPLAASNIDLRGSTRYCDGVMPDERQIAEVLAGRTDVVVARQKVASFFDRGLDRRPVKVISNTKPAGYEPAPGPGLPQFKLFNPIDWVFALDVPPGSSLKRATAAGIRW